MDVEKPIVLLVDDVLDVRTAVAELLDHAGFRVLEAANGHDALARAITLLPDINLMDVCLPLLDGVLTARVLRADPRTHAIPIIALTGRVLDAEDRDPFDHVLAKPCEPDALLDVLDGLPSRS